MARLALLSAVSILIVERHLNLTSHEPQFTLFEDDRRAKWSQRGSLSRVTGTELGRASQVASLRRRSVLAHSLPSAEPAEVLPMEKITMRAQT